MNKLTKTNCKELLVYFLSTAVLCLKMEGFFERLSISLCVQECVDWGYSIFSFLHIKGAINFSLLLLTECNTHTRTAERLGPDLANTEDELIYQIAASPYCTQSRPARVCAFPENERSSWRQRGSHDGEMGGGRKGEKTQGKLLIEEILCERKKKR